MRYLIHDIPYIGPIAEKIYLIFTILVALMIGKYRHFKLWFKPITPLRVFFALDV